MKKILLPFLEVTEKNHGSRKRKSPIKMDCGVVGGPGTRKRLF